MISIAEVRMHLRLMQDEADEMEIQPMIDAAVAAAADYLGRSIPEEMPAPVRAAILLQIGDLFENRERQGTETYYQNRTYERLLNPYRLLGM